MDLPCLVSEKPSPWRFVVMAASFTALFITGSMGYHTGALQVAILRHYNSDIITTTWMMAYYMSFFALGAPFASVVINMADCRTCVVLSGIFCLAGFTLSAVMTSVHTLFVTLSLAGMGHSLAFTGSLVILAYYFPTQSALVTGVCMAGAGLGMFVHPVLLAWMDELYGLPGAFLLAGAVAFHSSICGALMRPSRFERRHGQKSQGGSLLLRISRVLCGDWRERLSVMSNRSFVCFLFSVSLFSLTYGAMMVLLPAFIIRLSGLSTIQASFALSLVGVGSLVSRVLSGIIAQDERVGSLLIYCGVLGLQALVSLVAPFLLASGQIGVYTYTVLVGLYSGGAIVQINPVVLSVVGVRQSATGFGLALFAQGFAGLVGAPIVEIIHESSKSPQILFSFVASLYALSVVFAGMSACGRPDVPSAQKTAENRHIQDDNTTKCAHQNVSELPQENTSLLVSEISRTEENSIDISKTEENSTGQSHNCLS